MTPLKRIKTDFETRSQDADCEPHQDTDAPGSRA